MNSIKLSKILKKLSLPKYFIKNGRLAYYFVEHDNLKVIIGLYLDTSIDEQSFLAEYFIQPMFIEFPTLVFTIGKRVGGYWNEESLFDLSDEFNKIEKVESIDDIIAWIENKNELNDNPYLFQSLGYLYFIKKNFNKAISILKRFIKQKKNDDPEWKLKEAQKMMKFVALLENNDALSAASLLQEWQTRTMKQLKLN